jgi:hypothetical protein
MWLTISISSMFLFLRARYCVKTEQNGLEFSWKGRKTIFRGSFQTKSIDAAERPQHWPRTTKNIFFITMKNGNSSDESKVLSPAETWAVILEVWETVFGPSENENGP